MKLLKAKDLGITFTLITIDLCKGVARKKLRGVGKFCNFQI